jgi:hypothetical protein
MKLPLDRDQVPGDAAYDAIASTLPKGAARWPMQRDRCQCLIQVEATVVDRMRAMRGPGESHSHVILRLVELETGHPRPWWRARPPPPPGTSRKGGERTKDVDSGRTGVLAKAAVQLQARNTLRRPKQKTLPRVEAAFARTRTAHSSGIPALRRPSYNRSFISPKPGSRLWDIWCAFHAAIVLNGAVRRRARRFLQAARRRSPRRRECRRPRSARRRD